MNESLTLAERVCKIKTNAQNRKTHMQVLSQSNLKSRVYNRVQD